MIKSIEIQNFQSHKDTHLEFDKGVNVIVGLSDSGKSAILRAIRWLITNRPTGDSIRSYWGGKTLVRMYTDDAHIVRSKDKENEYILGDSHFKAFSTDVPKEIQDALNVSDINLQSQLDPHFLLSGSSGEVAQFFNRIAHLESIDTATSNINSAIRSLEQDIKYKTSEIERQEEQLKVFDYLDKMEADVEVLEELDKQYTNAIQREAKLNNFIEQIKETQREIFEYTPLLSLEGQVLELLALVEKRDTLEERKTDLLIDIRDILDHEEEIASKTTILNLESNVDNVLLLYNNVKTLKTQRNNVFKLLSQVNSITTTLNNNIALNVKLKAKFEKEMGNTCMLCGQTIKKE